MEYYEYTVVVAQSNYFSVITLHFKQWWKRSKTFRIMWNSTDSARLTRWSESPDSIELRDQLRACMLGRNEKTELRYEKA